MLAKFRERTQSRDEDHRSAGKRWQVRPFTRVGLKGARISGKDGDASTAVSEANKVRSETPEPRPAGLSSCSVKYLVAITASGFRVINPDEINAAHEENTDKPECLRYMVRTAFDSLGLIHFQGGFMANTRLLYV